MDKLRGFCYAHGEFEGKQCPKYPACETDTQVFHDDSPEAIKYEEEIFGKETVREYRKARTLKLI